MAIRKQKTIRGDMTQERSSEFGAFYPTGHGVVAFTQAASVRKASKGLLTRGYDQRDVLHFSAKAAARSLNNKRQNIGGDVQSGRHRQGTAQTGQAGRRRWRLFAGACRHVRRSRARDDRRALHASSGGAALRLARRKRAFPNGWPSQSGLVVTGCAQKPCGPGMNTFWSRCDRTVFEQMPSACSSV